MEAAVKATVDPPLPSLPTRLEKGQTKSKFSWQMLLLAVAIGIAAKAFGPSWARMLFQGISIETLGALSAFTAAFAAGIILHEAGHAVAGMLVDF